MKVKGEHFHTHILVSETSFTFTFTGVLFHGFEGVKVKRESAGVGGVPGKKASIISTVDLILNRPVHSM